MKGWPILRIETEKRRRAVLQTLLHTPKYRLNAAILREACEAEGIPSTEDQMMDCLAWLAELELLVLEPVPTPATCVAILTRRGSEAASGRRLIPGIARPDPDV